MWHFPEKVYESEQTLRKVILLPTHYFSFFLVCRAFSLQFLDFKVLSENTKLAASKYLQCAESALKSVIGDLSHTYFVGNAPMGHLIVRPSESDSSLKVSNLFLSATFSPILFIIWSTSVQALNTIHTFTHFASFS